MWVSRREFDELKRELSELRKRHEELANTFSDVTEPFRIGELTIGQHNLCWYPGWQDPRPKVTLRQAIDMLREHLKLKFTKTDAVPERIELERVE
jgi:hypothetical protein